MSAEVIHDTHYLREELYALVPMGTKVTIEE